LSINPPAPTSPNQQPSNEHDPADRFSHDPKTVASGDPAVRRVIAEELLAAISNEDKEIQQRARQLFIEHGYFDEAVRHLREAESASQRIAAAQTLGEFGSDLARAPLNAALFDNDPEVRTAAQAALERITLHSRTTELTPPPVSEPVEESRSTPANQPEIGVKLLEAESRRPAGSEQSVSTVAGKSDDVTDVGELLRNEDTFRKTLYALDSQLLELASALESSEGDVRAATERALKLRAETSDLRQQEDKLRREAEAATNQYEAEVAKKAEAEADSKRFAEELLHVRNEVDSVTQALLHVARERAEVSAARRARAEEARRTADELYNVELHRLRNEEAALRTAAEKAALRRTEVQQARRAIQEQTQRLLVEQSGLGVPEAAQLAQAERIHHEAEERHRLEQEELRLQVEKLNEVTRQVAARRESIEFTARTVEAENQRLAAAQAWLDNAEETRRQAERERLELGAQILKSIEEEHQRTSDAQELANQHELEAHEHESVEQQLLREIERLVAAETDARRRIEQAEQSRRAAVEACRQLEEKAIKVEAEAHRSKLEEEQALARLETARRDAATEFQTRAEQQKRVREEIEELRRLEVEERRRLEEESLRRSEAETRLQQERERVSAEEAARLRVEAEQSQLLEEYQSALTQQGELSDDPNENLRRLEVRANDQPPATVDLAEASVPRPLAGNTFYGEESESKIRVDVLAALQGEDASQRASALAALTGLGLKAALPMIVEAFDDASLEVRKAAALALHSLEPDGPAESFTTAFEEGSPERRRNIGLAIVESGLAAESINHLGRDNPADTYNALSLLLLMARAGEVQPLVQAIEEHDDLEVRRAAVRLLTMSGRSELADAAVKRRLSRNKI